jgi:ribosome-binding factor A
MPAPRRPNPRPRPSRVSEEVREVLAEEIPKLKDPRVGFVTVTGARASSDLRHAWVSYTTLGDERERASTRAGLRSATPHLRAVLGREVRLKFLPEIEFEEDDTLEQAKHVEELLHKLHEADRDV